MKSTPNQSEFIQPEELTSQSLHESLAKTITDGCWAYYPETGTVIWDANLKRNLGYEAADDLSFDHYLSLIHPDDRDAFLLDLKYLKIRGDRFISEHRIKVDEEGYKWIRGEGVLDVDDQGRMLILGFVRLMEKVARFSQHTKRQLELLELSEEIGKTGYFIWDPEERTATVSSGLKRLYNNTLSNFNPLDKGYLRTFHGDDAETLVDALNEMNCDEKKDDKTFQISMLKDGKRGTLKVKLHQSHNPRTEQCEIIGSVIDISEEVQLAADLRLSKSCALSILKHVPGAVYQLKVGVNEESIYTYLSPKLKSIFELSSDDDLDELWKIKQYLPAEDQVQFEKSIEEAIEQERDWYYSGRFITKSGKLKNFIASSTLSKEGDDLIFNGFVLDVSESTFKEQLMKRVEAATKTGTWEIDLRTENVHWSPETCQIHEVTTDFDPNLVKGIDFYEEKHSRPRIKAAVENLTNHGISYDERLQIITAEGNLRWVRTQGFADFANGKSMRLFGTIQDITDEMQGLHINKAMEAQISTISATTHYHLWTIRPNGSLDYINEDALLYLGISKDQAEDVQWSEYIHPEDYAEAKRVEDWAHETRSSYEIEYRIKRHDGLYQWFRVSASVISSDQGEFAGWSGISINIDDSKRTQEELKRSTRVLKATLEGTQAAVWDLDIENDCVDLTQAWYDVLGHDRDDGTILNLKEFGGLIHEDDYEKACEHFAGLSQEEPKVRIQLRILTNTNGYKWYDLKGRVHEWNLEGSPRRLLGIALPCDDVVEKEQTLLSLNRSLKHTNEELVEAKDEAQKLNQMKSGFISRVSHELRTPLSTIIGETELLIDQVERKATKEGLQLIESSAKVLQSIVSDLLDVTTLKDAEIRLSKEVGDLNHMIPALRKMGAYRLMEVDKQQQIKLKIEAEHIPFLIKADFIRIQQIFNNLLDNAIKYTIKGFIKVNVMVEQKDEEFFIRYEVLDSGVGFSNEMIEVIQQPFTQLNPSQLQTGGVGLGLYICKNLIGAMEGRLTVDSKKDKGSHFVVKIPIERARGQADMKRNEEVDSNHSAKPKVLIAEDNAINLHIASEQLKKLGLEHDTAANGQECIEKLKSAHFDLILMDLMMPVKDGYEATHDILADRSIVEKPYIAAFTANANQSDRESCEEIGMNDFIAKPVNLNDLRLLVKRWQDHKEHTL